MSWILCSERLPETDRMWTKYLVTTICDTWENPKTMAMDWENTTVYGEKTSRWKWNGKLLPKGWNVIAWMPLPEPYQGGKE